MAWVILSFAGAAMLYGYLLELKGTTWPIAVPWAAAVLFAALAAWSWGLIP